MTAARQSALLTFSRRSAYTLFLLFAVLLAGCGGEKRFVTDKISLEPHAAGDNQAGPYREVLARPLRVLVQGPQIRGLLGGKGSRSAVPGASVSFVVEDASSGAVFEESGAARIEVLTDSAGIAWASLRLGDTPGDVSVRAELETESGTKSVTFRAIAGIEVISEKTEGGVGESLGATGVRLTAPSGGPVPGVPVYFTAQDSSLAESRVLTDEQGRAITEWKLGSSAGEYGIHIEVQDDRTGISESERFNVRAIQLEGVALDFRRMAVFLLGGLAIFIFGMKLMSGGLQRMADRRLKAILEAATKNTALAVMVGAAMTAMVQSSSATTVMTVGFVNAGLITLKQAIGIIFGANIGTTITAQMIAFKLTSLAYPAIVIGMILSAVPRRPGLRYLGETIFGFGLLFLGMMTMSDVLKPLRHSEDFIQLFQMFDCSPVNGSIPWQAVLMCILIGTIVTVVVQSSSASIGLVLALCGQGLIPLYTAFPLILGDNIGTTVTAVLASLGANRNAKRTALAHTMFNVIGATYMFVLLFVPLWNGQPLFLGFIDAITPGDVFNETPENLPRHVANAHTAFNIMNCMIFIPLVGTMVWICQRVIPATDAESESVLEYLEPHLLRSPSLALERAISEVTYMLRRAQKSINDGCDLFCGGPHSLEKKIAEREDIIDRLQSEITSYLVDLSRMPLSPAESALIPGLIHAVNDVERIGDHSENLVELTQLKREYSRELTKPAEDDLRRLQHLVNEQCHAVYKMLEDEDPSQLYEVMKKEAGINALLTEASDGHVARLKSGECDVQTGVLFLDFLGNLERVGDHLVNIAERSAKLVST